MSRSYENEALHLVLVEDRPEQAEQLVSTLRNAGIAVRPVRATNPDEFAQMLAGTTAPHLVLAAITATSVPLAKVVALVAASGKDISVIATTPALTEETVLHVSELGARHVVLSTSPEHVRQVVQSEFAAVLTRRRLRTLEAQLRETERRCDALIESSRDPIAYIHEGMHIRANEAYLEMFGYESFDAIEGLSVLDLIAPSHTDAFKQLLRRLGRGEQPPKSMQISAQASDGSVFDAELEFIRASYEGEPCLQIVFRRKVLDAEMLRELDELRQRDALTGLFNRQHFLGVLEQIVTRAGDGGSGDHALLLIEPDHIAGLVADIGIAHIDEFALALADRLRSACGEPHILARFSEHGFAALLNAVDHQLSERIADRIRQAFADAIVVAGERSLSVTVSIGGVQIGTHPTSLDTILAKASQHLQIAQAEGGNRYSLFDPLATTREEMERIANWVRRIEEATRSDDHFVLYYQPIVNLRGEPGEHYEVLLRMRGSGGELIQPLTFLPIAEEHGLLEAIDTWVVTHALDVLAQRQAQGIQTVLFVKLCAPSLSSVTLPKLIGKRLVAHKLRGSSLVLEIPEAKAVTNLKAAQEFQQALAPLGVRLALEQFGANPNSSQLLRHLDPAFLKLDRSFLVDLGTNANNQKKIGEIVRLAESLGKQTIAEFVQDASTMTVLYSTGVSMVEGPFLAPAGPHMNYDFG